MAELPGWQRGRFAADGRRYDTYRRGAGPGVVVIHEAPGITPPVLSYAEELVRAGFTVVLPHLFGTLNDNGSLAVGVRLAARLCVRREFTKLATGVTSPIAGWLRALAAALHRELGGPGVGAVGMCFTGGFALAMAVEPAVLAPVVAQPALPFAIGRRRAADVNLCPADRAALAARDCPVLGLRYRADRVTGTRFDTLRALLGARFTAVEFAGRGHATLTAERQQEAVDATVAFLTGRLMPTATPR